VPGKQRIGCHNRLQFIKCLATEHLGLHGQSYPLFVGESKPLSFELILEYTVLLYKIVDHCLLLAVKPAGQGNYEEMERLYSVYHCTNRLSVILFDNNIIQFVRIFAPYACAKRYLRPERSRRSSCLRHSYGQPVRRQATSSPDRSRACSYALRTYVRSRDIGTVGVDRSERGKSMTDHFRRATNALYARFVRT